MDDAASHSLATPAPAPAGPARAAPRARLFRKYVALFVAVVSVALLANGAFETWFSYRDHEASLIRLQREQAAAAAAKIGQFVSEIQSQIGWTTELPWSGATLEQRRFDALRLLRQVPAITELAQLDASGHEQLRVSRLEMDAVGANIDRAHDPAFVEAMAHKVWYGPVYFRRESEPYMTLAAAGTRKDAGVSVAEINLKFIWDVVSQIKVGEHGLAFVVDGSGRLIAHPDISLVLRNTNLAQLPQVQAARGAPANGPTEETTSARDVSGRRVLSAFARVEPLDWLVFVELPIDEAYAPLYASIARAAALLAACLVLAFGAGLFLARRMVGPIQALRAGAARLGGGDLGQRIAIRTGDELEALADQFNDMAGRLQESYANLERKVEDRTRELSEALEQQTATSEVLGAIAASPGDAQRVLDIIAGTTQSLFGAARVIITRIEGETFRQLSSGQTGLAMADRLSGTPVDSRSVAGRAALERRTVQVDDILAHLDEFPRTTGEVRTVVATPLLREGEAIGTIAMSRAEVRPFSAKQLELLQSFAAQAVIAIENARLLTELRESLEQQTATANILGVISASPGELAPVFDAILENALRLAEADTGLLARRAGDTLVTAVVRDEDRPDFADELRMMQFPPRQESMPWDAIRSKEPQQRLDTREAPDYLAGVPGTVLCVETGGLRTVLWVPIVREDEAVGVIGLYRREVRAFDPDHVELVSGFAKQAAIAIENARLLSELRESLDRQTAMAEVLGVISSSPGELKPVFQSMLANAMRICEAQCGFIYQLESDGMRAVAESGVSPAFAEYRRTHPHTGGAGTPADVMRATRKPAHVHDARDSEPYRAGNPNAVAGVDLGGARTVLYVPMLKDDEIVGVINVFRQEVRPFDDDQIALLENFAAQAVIAIENARLLTELRDSLERQTAMAQVLSVISSSPGELQPVFETVAERSVRLCEADRAFIFRYDGALLRMITAFNAAPEFAAWVAKNPIRPGRHSGSARAALERRTIHIPDVRADPEYSYGAKDVEDIRTILGVPIVKGEELLGVIMIYRLEVRPFTQKQVELVENFAAQAVIAIENARLLGELNARNSDLAQSLERQTATADILRVIASTPGDPTHALDTIAETAVRMFDASNVAIRRIEGDVLRFVATAGPQTAIIRSRVYDAPLHAGDWLSKAVRENRQISRDDLQREMAEWPPALRDAIRDMGIRTVAYTPLTRDGKAIGGMVVNRTEVRPFRPDELEVMRGFADQAVIAIENARLLTELRESLDRQTAMAEVLGVISASPGELDPVFRAVLENATGICAATCAQLIRHDGRDFYTAATLNVPPAHAEFMQRGPHTVEPGSGLDRIVRTKRTLHLPDVRSDPAYLARQPRFVATVAAGLLTELFVPMLKNNTVIGVIIVFRAEVRPFSDKEIELVENFAAQAVIAIENARLLTELRESLDRQTATSEVLGVISASPGELQPVFATMIEKATRLCDARVGTLALYDGKGFRGAAVYGHGETYADTVSRFHSPPPGTGLWRLAQQRETVQVSDAAADAAYAAVREMNPDFARVRTALYVPIAKEDELIGALLVYRHEVRPFDEKQVALLENFAAQAVIAIENARLLTELRARTDDLAESLEQQTATSEVLRVISRSSFDLKPVFDAIAENAVRICEAERAFIFRFDGELLRAIAYCNVGPDIREFVDRNPIAPGRYTVSARAALERRTVHIRDVQAEPDYAYAVRDVDLIRTTLAVPMLKGDELVGIITIYRLEIKPFTDKQIALVENFAAQAVIAIENARLLTELNARNTDLAQSLERQTATSDILRAIAAAPDAAEDTLHKIAETTTRLFGATGVSLRIAEDGEYTMSIGVGRGAEQVSQVLPAVVGTRRPVAPRTLPGSVILENRQIHLADLDDLDPDIADWPGPPIARAAGIRTMVGTPLRREDRAIGAMIVYRDVLRPFDEGERRLLQSFADQAAIAIANTRLLTEIRARTDELARSVGELTALGEVTQAVNSTLELQTVLSTIVAKAVEISATDAGAIYEFEPARDAFLLRATHGMDEAMIAAIREQRIGLGVAVIGEAASRRTPVMIEDLAATPPNPVTDIILEAGFHALLVIPLLRPGRIVGALVVRRRAPGAFPTATLELLQTFAAQSVIAIQNARLFQEIEEKGRELAVASQHKSQFLANMSHELRTPLNAILGYTELILDDIYGAAPAKMREVLERVQTNGKHLLGLINDVLDLSKIEAGQLSLALADYSIKDLLQGVYVAVEPLAAAKGLALKLDVPAGLPPARGDERRLSQVILNLVGNAIKFTDQGEVSLSARAANGVLTIAVRDTGPGIAESDQAKIFEEFQQADNSSTRQKGGTGLGLAISRRIVQLHGGRLWVESRLGLGSTFLFTLPVTVERQVVHA